VYKADPADETIDGNGGMTRRTAALLVVLGMLAAGCTGSDDAGAGADVSSHHDADDTATALDFGATADTTGPAPHDVAGNDPAGVPPDDATGGGAETATTCTPGALACADAITPSRCRADGSGFVALGPCPDYQGCDAATGQCTPYQCTPGTAACTDDVHLVTCSTDVAVGAVTTDCSPGRCANAKCQAVACIPAVFFLVDRSSSMKDSWPDVRTSVAAVIGQHPEFRYGMAAFPAVQSSCTTGSTWPHAALSDDGGQAIDAWFAANGTVQSTPLLDAVVWVSQHVDLVWGTGKSNGHLVVITDGQDSCGCDQEYTQAAKVACVVDGLAAATTALSDQGLRTYVIGFNYDGDPAELNAMAANGGTSFPAYIPAGDEATLTAAVAQFVGALKMCQ
jgi:hypothetical protein